MSDNERWPRLLTTSSKDPTNSNDGLAVVRETLTIYCLTKVWKLSTVIWQAPTIWERGQTRKIIYGLKRKNVLQKWKNVFVINWKCFQFQGITLSPPVGKLMVTLLLVTQSRRQLWKRWKLLKVEPIVQQSKIPQHFCHWHVDAQSKKRKGRKPSRVRAHRSFVLCSSQNKLHSSMHQL